MMAADVLVLLAAELGLVGVLLGLLIVAAFGFMERISVYRIEVHAVGRCIAEMEKFFRAGENPAPADPTRMGLPEAMETAAGKEVELTINLLKSVVYGAALTIAGLLYAMWVIVIQAQVTAEIVYLYLVPSSLAVGLVVLLTVVLIREVIQMSEGAANVHANLSKLMSGSVQLERKDGKVITYRPGESLTPDSLHDPSLWGM